MALQTYIDPATGRPAAANTLTPTTHEDPANISGLAGRELQRVMLQNIEDGKRNGNYVIFDGVADWNGSTGTDNGTAWNAAITAAYADPSPFTTVIVPQGRYYIGTTNHTYNATKEIAIVGIGDVEIVGNNTTAIMSFNGELASLGLHPTPTLNGAHSRTSSVGTDGRTYYRGVLTLNTDIAHQASVGEPCCLYGVEQYATTWAYLTCHMSHVVGVPTTTSVTIAHETFFDFQNGDTVWFPRYWGPLHFENIKFKNIWSSDSTNILNIYRCNNTTFKDCEFDLIANPGGQSDCVNISDCFNIHVGNCKFANSRYGINANRVRNMVCRTNEINYCRHFVSWGTASYGLFVDHAWGTGNASIVDGHNSFEAHFRNIKDLGSYNSAENVFNCRNFGYSIENAEWEGTTIGTPTYYMSGQTLISKYHDLWRKHQIHIKNVSLRNSVPTTFSIGDAGRVSIDGLTLDGQTTVDIGSGTYGVDYQEIKNVTGETSIRNFKAIHTQDEQPRKWNDADYTEYTGTATAGGASTITIEDHTLADDDLNGYLIEITGGTGNGQVRYITDYVDSTLVATVDTAWATPPDATSIYRISLYEIDASDMRYYGVAYRWNKVFSHLWGGDVTNGETDLRTRRLRLAINSQQTLASPDANPARFEVVSLRFILNHSFTGTKPYRQEWLYKISHKVVPTSGVDVTYCGHEGLYHATNDWSLTASDWVTPFPSVHDGIVDVSLKLGANVAGHSFFLEADASGYG